MLTVDRDFSCKICRKTFSSQASLKLHIRRNHGGYKFSCYYCKHETKFKNCLTRHIWRQHLKKDNSKIVCIKCTLCIFECVSRKEMISHYVTKHDVTIQEQTLEFGDHDKFMKWKEDIEQDDVCQFIACCGPRKRQAVRIRYYRCFRDGNFKEKGKGLRHMKIKGSIKMNGVCPASIKTEEDITSGVVRVSFIPTHVGHLKELDRLKLSKNEKAEIASKLAEGISYESILDSVHESVKNGKIRRLHLTTRKDLYNIQNSFCFQRTEKDENDCTSAEPWINLMEKESNVVRFYKPQGTLLSEVSELVEDDMVLIIATTAQIEMLKTYGTNLVCFDGTHGSNAYDFELTTILILNGMRQVFPCAYMFSNRSDSVTMTLFSKVLKSLLDAPIQVNILMSNMSEIYMKGWSNVMPRPKHFLFCSWHVEHDWIKNLTKIRDLDKRSEVHKSLKIIMFEKCEAAFLRIFENFVKDLENNVLTSDFGFYFKNTYCNNIESWAYCYRKNMDISNNMFLENMHKALKYLYLGGNKIKRLHQTVSALLRLTRDKSLDQLICKERGKLTSQIAAVQVRHRCSIKMAFSVVSFGGGWLVTSQSGEETYLVHKTDIEQCNCEVKCVECGICLHSFNCDCIDSLIKSNICKHIHSVSLYMARQKESFVESSDSENDNSELIVCEHNKNIHDEVIVEELSKKNPSSENELEGKKMKIWNKIENLLENVQNDEHVKIFWNALLPLDQKFKRNPPL